jgi:hypothetical protein
LQCVYHFRFVGFPLIDIDKFGILTRNGAADICSIMCLYRGFCSTGEGQRNDIKPIKNILTLDFRVISTAL